VDDILKAFSIGFLLRSAFAGVFFVISYFAAWHTSKELQKAIYATDFAFVLPVSLIIGVSVYGIHRSLVYPLLEWLFDSGCVKKMRRKLPLISDSALKTILFRWDSSAGGDEKWSLKNARTRHFTTWADYAHSQYVSALCLVLGALVASFVVGGSHQPCPPLIVLGVLFLLAGFVSDWRLRSILDHVQHSNL
jgi:hypothetical protein